MAPTQNLEDLLHNSLQQVKEKVKEGVLNQKHHPLNLDIGLAFVLAQLSKFAHSSKEENSRDKNQFSSYEEEWPRLSGSVVDVVLSSSRVSGDKVIYDLLQLVEKVLKNPVLDYLRESSTQDERRQENKNVERGINYEDIISWFKDAKTVVAGIKNKLNIEQPSLIRSVIESQLIFTYRILSDGKEDARKRLSFAQKCIDETIIKKSKDWVNGSNRKFIDDLSQILGQNGILGFIEEELKLEKKPNMSFFLTQYLNIVMKPFNLKEELFSGKLEVFLNSLLRFYFGLNVATSNPTLDLFGDFLVRYFVGEIYGVNVVKRKVRKKVVDKKFGIIPVEREVEDVVVEEERARLKYHDLNLVQRLEDIGTFVLVILGREANNLDLKYLERFSQMSYRFSEALAWYILNESGENKGLNTRILGLSYYTLMTHLVKLSQDNNTEEMLRGAYSYFKSLLGHSSDL